jgi:adenine phosphoribosyltransferase
MIVVMETTESARAAFLRTFRWTDGHADFASVLRGGNTLGLLGRALAVPFTDAGATVVVALEARGFVVGALCAEQLGVGLVLARKPGSVYPGEKIEVVSAPDWRGRAVTIRLARVLAPMDKVLLVDDWIQTGNQARAVRQAIEASGAQYIGASVVVDDTDGSTRSELKVTALVSSAELR